MIIPVKTSTHDYNITLLRGSLKNLPTDIDRTKRALIVTDTGVPGEYSEAVKKQFSFARILTLPMGEGNKNLISYQTVLKTLTECEFTRNDAVVAVGGGVVGDLSGFAAATYLRGITFYNIPTTLLSQVDSSIGGKTAVDFCGYKNTVGAFYPPHAVVIDPETLMTLSDRQFNNGLCEAIKMAATSDVGLFELFENGDAISDIDEIIRRSLMIKKQVVESDEHETGLRKILNFGHTVGHAIEVTGSDFLHGECVGIGMLNMCSEKASERINAVLIKNHLPVSADRNADELYNAVLHDKKRNSDGISVVYVNEIGSAIIEEMPLNIIKDKLKEALK